MGVATHELAKNSNISQVKIVCKGLLGMEPLPLVLVSVLGPANP